MHQMCVVTMGMFQRAPYVDNEQRIEHINLLTPWIADY